MLGSDLSLKAGNQLLIVDLGGLEPLTRLMLSSAIGVQHRAMSCISGLSRHGTN